MRRWIFAVLLAPSACTDVIDLDPIDETAVREASVRPPAISGGTLMITSDGLAVAADPDRDLVHVVELATETVRHAIALQPGDEPGRVVQGSGTLAHVVLRGAGAIATIDLASAAVTRTSVCPDPRGIAFEAEVATLHVACADGTLLHMPESGEGETVAQQLAPDLRDVVMLDGQVWVSRFRDAAIEHPELGYTRRAEGGTFEARVAWRTIPDPRVGFGAGVLMLHQLADTSAIPIDGDAEVSGIDGGGGDGGELPYGGGGDTCEPGITGPALTVLGSGEEEFQTLALRQMPLAVDVAISPVNDVVALAVPGAPEGTSTLIVTPFGDTCSAELPPDVGNGQVTAVAFAADGTLVAQSREPAQLIVRAADDVFDVVGRRIALEGESRFDTGHEIFHRATESSLSCASCHPEAGDDGHVWSFVGLGPRRTQPLDVGLRDTAPFHWDGEMDDLDMIMNEVLSHRMGGMRQSEARRDSFARWLFERERAPARIAGDTAIVEQGLAAFGSFGCTRCHAGEHLVSNQTVEIEGKMLQVPSLRRIALRPPFMHDGRAETLEEAVADMIATTSPSTAATDEEIAAIAAYLRTQ